MAIKKSDLYASLWASCDELRGGMDASQYKDYVLLLFIKYISDKYEQHRLCAAGHHPERREYHRKHASNQRSREHAPGWARPGILGPEDRTPEVVISLGM
jgi:type I restriction-modification system DNA methylase subunit